METTTNPTNFAAARCTYCGDVARLTRAGWRHGWPPHGHDGHCVGTALWPTVDEEVSTLTQA